MDTLGVVESRSIAAGVELADTMVKAADVRLVRASTICSGRYMIYVAGEQEAVKTSVQSARDSGRALAGSFVISRIAPQVLDVLRKSDAPQPGDALGVVESRIVSACILAADRAVKQADIRLTRLVTGQGINGKAYFVLCGEVAAVRESVAAAEAVLGEKLVEAVVIPRPDGAVLEALGGR